MSRNTRRLTALARIRQTVGNSSADSMSKEREHIFCIRDGDQIRARRSQVEFGHKRHKSTRAFIFDDRTKWEFRGDGELRHFSVGAILWRRNGRRREYCLFRTRRHPIGYYMIPAGHLEISEVPEEAARREIDEETKLKVLSFKLRHKGEVYPDQCRRGADYHYWYLYIGECIGEPQLSHAHDVIGWFGRDEVMNKLRLTEAAGYFFGKYFKEEPRNVRN